MLENQIPLPPVDMQMPAQANDIYALITYSLLALFALWTLRESLRMRSPLLLLILLGGTLSCMIEPIVDHVGGVWWPQYGAEHVFRAFNVAIPVWVVAAWGLYVGALATLLYRKMAAGITVKQLWVAYFAIWGFSLLLELPGLHLGLYRYYADQPFNVLGFPLWWAMTNVSILVIAAAILTGYREFFTGVKMLLVVPLMPMVSAGAEAATGFPMWLALNTGTGPTGKFAAGLMTLGLSLMVVHMVSLKFCVPPRRA